jgi:hypothetical protein
VVQEGGWVKVVSDTYHDKWYRVDMPPTREGCPVTFICQPEGSKAYADDHRVVQGYGTTPCMHAALAARRLEREGLAVFNGEQWLAVLTTIHECTMFDDSKCIECGAPEDPWKGLL